MGLTKKYLVPSAFAFDTQQTALGTSLHETRASFVHGELCIRLGSHYVALHFLANRMLPLSLLRTAVGHPILVELKNGETLNGQLVNCDAWMNMNLRDVICTSRVC